MAIDYLLIPYKWLFNSFVRITYIQVVADYIHIDTATEIIDNYIWVGLSSYLHILQYKNKPPIGQQ